MSLGRVMAFRATSGTCSLTATVSVVVVVVVVVLVGAEPAGCSAGGDVPDGRGVPTGSRTAICGGG